MLLVILPANKQKQCINCLSNVYIVARDFEAANASRSSVCSVGLVIVKVGEIVYVGCANLSGAGICMKSDGKHYFGAGFLTNDSGFIDVMS